MENRIRVNSFRGCIELALGSGPAAVIHILATSEARRLAGELMAMADCLDAEKGHAEKQEASEIARVKRDMQQLATSMQAMGEKVARLEELASMRAVTIPDGWLDTIEPAFRPFTRKTPLGQEQPDA